MDFMNLNQAAHGDREFGYVQTRLGVRPQDGRRARVRPGVVARIDALGARRGRRATTCDGCGWPASATTCATSP